MQMTGKALKAWRVEQGLTLRGLADKLSTDKFSVSHGSIDRIERGEQWPSFDFMVKILSITRGKVTPNDFVPAHVMRRYQ